MIRIFSGKIELLLLIHPKCFFDLSVVPSFLVRKVENKSFPRTHKLGERTGQVWRDNSRRVRTHEKNSGETVRRLGTIIQSIFCTQSGASLRSAEAFPVVASLIKSRHPLEFLEIVRWESWYPGALSPVHENFRPAFSPDPTDCPCVSEDASNANSYNANFKQIYIDGQQSLHAAKTTRGPRALGATRL